MDEFFLDLSVVLVISAAFSTLAVILKQPILLAYILCGILIGPLGLGWVESVSFLEGISHLGITLLLFLAGLCLHPQKLYRLFKEAAVVTGVNSVLSFLGGFILTYLFEFSLIDCVVVGLAMMFSSTILVVKLLPTTELHQKHMGAVCIGVLILQDLLAVAVLAFIRCLGSPDGALLSFSILSVKVAVFVVVLFVFEYFVLRKLMAKVDRLHEALFILGLAWCFGVASISYKMGLFYETGAFFSGVALARHRISQFIHEELKPLRDFFLVLFFFTLGARLELQGMQDLLIITILLAAGILFVRPFIIKKSLMFSGEKPGFSEEAGVRLGQLSEFALLIGFLAVEEKLISNKATQLIQLVTIITFVMSSYIIFRRYATPIGIEIGKAKT